MNPLEPLVEALVSRLGVNDREVYEERAGILQFEASRPRELAELLALLDVCRMNPLALVGAVCSMSGLAPRGSVYVLATTATSATASLGLLGAHQAAPADLPIALASLGGAACLTALQPLKKKREKPRI
jgi:hypothetical protein